MSFIICNRRDELTKENIVEIRYTDADIYKLKPKTIRKLNCLWDIFERLLREKKEV